MDAIYAGSFDPFTNGHLDIVFQASELFDNVIIAIAKNDNKRTNYVPQKMRSAIEDTLQWNSIHNCTVEIVEDELIADFARRKNVRHLVRGIRNAIDYNYEENIAKINREINRNLSTVYLRATHDHISSSMVKELFKYGKNIDAYVPYAVSNLMNG